MSKELISKNHAEYGEMISIIERARETAFRAVNRELITMYWEIGAYAQLAACPCAGCKINRIFTQQQPRFANAGFPVRPVC